MKNREGFNFYRSYYETGLLLEGEDRLEFLDAIINYQFTGELIEPKRKLALLAFKGQIHSIKKQVIGYQKGLQTYPNGNPTKGKHKGNDKGSHKEVQVQGEVQVKDKVEVQVQEQYAKEIGECSPLILPILMNWLEYKREKKDKYTVSGLKSLVRKFNSFAHDYSGLESLVENSIMNGYQGIIWNKYVPSNKKTEPTSETPEQRRYRLISQTL